MVGIALTIALFGFILTLVVDVVRRDGGKVIAALEGHSWKAGSTGSRPITIRFNPRRTEVELEPLWQPALRVAA